MFHESVFIVSSIFHQEQEMTLIKSKRVTAKLKTDFVLAFSFLIFPENYSTMYIILIIQNEAPRGKVNKETRVEKPLDFDFRAHGNEERDKTTLQNSERLVTKCKN